MTQKNKIPFKWVNSGQSLIETVMAIFVLTTGLASGLALAVYTFGSSSDITEKIAATGLAREGVEVIRRMRDSNWLADSLADCGGGQFCYPNWLSAVYNIQGAGGAGNIYRLVFDSSSMGNKWTVSPSDAGSDYRLYVQPGGELSHIFSVQPSNLLRKVSIINQDTAAPYSATSPLVLVRVVVWWHGKNCALITYFNNPSDTSCKIITEEYLTNWRNY